MAASANDDTNNNEKIFTLTGQVTYVEWFRLFKRAARNEELWEMLNGDEHCRSTPPTLESCVIHEPKPTAPGPITRSQDKEERPKVDTALTMMNFQQQERLFRDNRQKQKKARALLFKWVSDDIVMEIEDLKNPALMAAHIKSQYGLSTEKIQEDVINKLDNLKLDDCKSMSDYISKHRAMKADLTSAEYSYSDTQYNTNVIRGLPDKYNRFKNQWRWFLDTTEKKTAEPATLHRKLLEEEVELKKQNEKRKTNRPANVQIQTNSNVYVKKEPNQGPVKKCTFEGCGRLGHTIETCYFRDKSLMPQSIKDTIQKNKEKNLATLANHHSNLPTKQHNMSTSPTKMLKTMKQRVSTKIHTLHTLYLMILVCDA